MARRMSERGGLARQPRIVSLSPELTQVGTHAFENGTVRWIRRKVVHFRRILPQVIKFLRLAMQKCVQRAHAEAS